MTRGISRIIKLISMPVNWITLNRKKIRLGRGVDLVGIIHVHGKGDIEIGDESVIISARRINETSGGGNTSFTAEEGAHIRIGKHVGISHSYISSFSSVDIGDNVLIGSNCMITDTDFHPIGSEARLRDSREEVLCRPVIIDSGAFVGARTIILKGVHIGMNSVIGAGSVVTRDVPEMEIWAGNPAKYIRKVV